MSIETIITILNIATIAAATIAAAITWIGFTLYNIYLVSMYRPGVMGRMILFLLGFMLLVISIFCWKEAKMKSAVKTTLDQEYYGYSNYKTTLDQKYYGYFRSFVYNGNKYNIDYDDTTNTLVIFEADGVSVDTTYVNGQEQVINENN